MLITPSNMQYAGITAVANWYNHQRAPFFYLAGHAGAGKTSLVKFIIDQCNIPSWKTVVYGSFTGKAALVMRRKGMTNATTIHSLIYKMKDKSRDDKGKVVLNFVRDNESLLRDAGLVVLDECSMIDDRTAQDLLSFGVKVLVLGDPGQLDPIKGTGYFTRNKPNFFLSEIHRQALNNPIIYYSMLVREGKPLPYCNTGEFRRMKVEDVDPDEFLRTDQILTGKHVTRRELNQVVLGMEGFDELRYPVVPGVKMLNLRNDHGMELFNGMIGRSTEYVDASDVDTEGRKFIQSVQLEDTVPGEKELFEDLNVHMGHFDDNFKLRTDEQSTRDGEILDASRLGGEFGSVEATQKQTEWDFGYAITVHKSQGSQWNNHIIYDDGMLSWDVHARRKWMYTAITRGVESVLVTV